MAEYLDERRSLDELHREVRTIADRARVEQADQPRVLEPLECSRLLDQATRGRRITGAHDLERNLASAFEVRGPVDVGHPAVPEQAVQPVAIGEHPIEREVDRGHRSNPWHR